MAGRDEARNGKLGPTAPLPPVFSGKNVTATLCEATQQGKTLRKFSEINNCNQIKEKIVRLIIFHEK